MVIMLCITPGIFTLKYFSTVFLFPKMAIPSVMVLPLLVVVFAGIYYFYNEVIHFMSKSVVRNKVVVITDAVSAMGSGNALTCFFFDLVIVYVYITLVCLHGTCVSTVYSWTELYF